MGGCTRWEEDWRCEMDDTAQWGEDPYARDTQRRIGGRLGKMGRGLSTLGGGLGERGEDSNITKETLAAGAGKGSRLGEPG